MSAVYDVLLGLSLLFLRDMFAGTFAVPAPQPPIHADLNGLFTIVIGLGYLLPYRDPWRYRAYLWLMGPGLKGAGAVWFVGDYLVRQSPPAFLLFAVTDGLLALVTAWALVVTRASRPADGGNAGTSRAVSPRR